MKIVYFSYLYDLNGISLGARIKADELMSELRKLGHAVKAFWLNKQPTNSDNITANARKNLKQKLSRYLHEPSQLIANLKYFSREFRIVGAESPDLIITRLDTYLISSLLVSKLKKIPLVIELDNPVAYEFATFETNFKKNIGLVKLLEKLNLRHSNRVFTVSDELKDFYTNEGVPDNKINVICNGANIERFSPAIERNGISEKYGLGDSVVVGFVGTFHYWHGIENLKVVLEKVLSLGDGVRFLMVGSGGPMKAQLQVYIENKNLQDRAILTGYVAHEDIPKHIAAMDIVLAPYPNLDFFYYSPIKIFEYMACGKPVVTTRIGQVASLIKDGENGFLCEPDNIDEMVQRISMLIKDRELRMVVGREARKSIENSHSWDRKAKQLSKLCEEVVRV